MNAGSEDDDRTTMDEHPMAALGDRGEASGDSVEKARKVRVFEALFSPESSSSPESSFTIFGSYLVRDTLGRGGMGVVQRAYDFKLNREVAIKLLHGHLDERYTKRLKREAQAMAKLSHPNVVQVYEVGEVEGRTFVAMELVKGQTAREWMLQEPRPDWRSCVELFIQLGEGLIAAHEKGLVHRDFKPGNAIIDEKGRARVLDFGLARRKGEGGEVVGETGLLIANHRARTSESDVVPLDLSLTKTGKVMGTPAYMSPEQIQGLSANELSDQFSFCASLYEAVYGERPYEGPDLLTLLAAMKQGMVRPAPRGSEVPAKLREALVRGLALDPAKRWPSMEELLRELRRQVAPRTIGWVASSGVIAAVVATMVALFLSEKLSEKDQQLEVKEAELERQWVEIRHEKRLLSDEKHRVSELRAVHEGDRAKTLAQVAGHQLDALRLAVDAVQTLGPRPASVRTEVFEGLTHALESIHGGIVMRGHDSKVHGVAVSADGRMVATASADGMVRLWDAYSGVLRQELEGHRGAVSEVVFFPDGVRLATAGADETARIWDVHTGEVLESFPHPGPVGGVAVSPDGTRLATASGDTGWIWHLGTDAFVVPLTGHVARIRSVVFSPDAQRVHTASEDHTARTWDAARGTCVRTLAGHTDRVLDIDVSHDGAQIVTGSRDGTARVWDEATGAELDSFDHGEVVYAVALSRDGSRLATGTFDDGVARVWDLRSGHQVFLARHDDAVVDVAFSPRGDQLVTASWDFFTRSWDLEPARALVGLPHPRGVEAVAYSPDGTRVVTAGGGGEVRMWDPRSGRLLTASKGHRLDVLAAAYSPDGRVLATASWDGSIRLWDASDLAHRATLRGHTGPVGAIAFSPDGARLASGGRDGTVRVWDAASGELLHWSWHREPGRSPVVDIVFTPDGQRLLTIGADDELRAWDATTEDARLELPYGVVRDGRAVTAVALSADGRFIAIATDDAAVLVYGVESGDVHATLSGHIAPVVTMSFHGSATLATGSRDGTARIWDVEERVQRVAFPHAGPVTSVAWSPDGKTLTTACGDEMARSWKVEIDPWLDWGCAVLERRPTDGESGSPVCERARAAVSPGVDLGSSVVPPSTVPSDLDAPEVITVQGVELVLIPGGTFTMGSPAAERGRFDREGPPHEVTLDSFYLARTPVTNEQYARFLEDNPGVPEPPAWKFERLDQPDQPVVTVSWLRAKQYCEWAGLELPTEAQWEYAARAGTTSAYWFGDDAGQLDRFGWDENNTGARARGLQHGRGRSVARKGDNPFGLFDVHGSVWEWCEDAYGPYDARARVGDGLRHRPAGGRDRVTRGGSWDLHPGYARSAQRSWYAPKTRNFAVGFRPAKKSAQ